MSNWTKSAPSTIEPGQTYRDSERVIAVEYRTEHSVTYRAFTHEGTWLYRETCPLYQFVFLVDGAEFQETTPFEVTELFKLPRCYHGHDWGKSLSYWLRRGDRSLAHWPSGGYWNRGWNPHPTSVILLRERGWHWRTLIEGSWNKPRGMEHVWQIAEFFQVSVGSVVAAITHKQFKQTTLVFEGEAKDDKAN